MQGFCEIQLFMATTNPSESKVSKTKELGDNALSRPKINARGPIFPHTRMTRWLLGRSEN